MDEVKPHIKIKRMGLKRGWIFDDKLRRSCQAIIQLYAVDCPYSGLWFMKIDELPGEHTLYVKPIFSSGSTKTHAYIENQVDVFKKSIDRERYYHILRINNYETINPKGPVIGPIDEIPKEIRENYELQRYFDVTGKIRTPLRNAWVVLVKPNDFEGMIKLFLYERVWPIKDYVLDEF